MFSDLLQLNYRLFQLVNAPAGSHPILDALMIFSANSLIFLWPLLLLMVWGIPVSWRRRALRPGEAEIIQERRALVLWVAFACLLGYAINLMLEQFIFEPRPFISHKVHLLVAHAADASFPSDHSAWSFAVVGMLLFALFVPTINVLRTRRLRSGQVESGSLLVPLLLLVAAIVIASVIGIARVYVGVHYPGDIIGGALDGLIAAFVITLLRHWLERPTHAVLRFAQSLRVA